MRQTVLCNVALAASLLAQRSVMRYAIVSGDSQHTAGEWESQDEQRLKKFRSKFGSHFAWFEQDGRDFIVTSDEVMVELDHAMAPQREVNRHQGDVNRHQGEVNRKQAVVNSHQRNVNRAQGG